MWLSQKLSIDRTARQEGAATDMGITTIGGANASVETRGEQRDLEIFAPGGLVWQPHAGDTVLVVKGGSGAKEACVVAAETASQAPGEMSPGELYLYADGGTYIYLRSDGTISIHGNVSIDGKLEVNGNVKLVGQVDIWGSLYVNGIPYRRCSCT